MLFYSFAAKIIFVDVLIVQIQSSGPATTLLIWVKWPNREIARLVINAKM